MMMFILATQKLNNLSRMEMGKSPRWGWGSTSTNLSDCDVLNIILQFAQISELDSIPAIMASIKNVLLPPSILKIRWNTTFPRWQFLPRISRYYAQECALKFHTVVKYTGMINHEYLLYENSLQIQTLVGYWHASMDLALKLVSWNTPDKKIHVELVA